jgi:glycosyltransferase involved in cell wall biosynthesis
MNLLVDAHVFDGKYQGTRTYLEGMYKEMIKHEDIDFFFAASKLDIVKNIFGVADNIHYVNLKSQNKVQRLIFEFPQIIRKYKIDFAHFQYISPLFKTCREIVTVHDLLFLDMPELFPWLYRIKNAALFKRSSKRADILLTVSEFSKSEIVRHFNINNDRIHITYNSILPANINTDSIDLGKLYGLDKYILEVGRIEPRKNHLSLLRAFVKLGLTNKGYKLVMVGSKDLAYTEFFNYYNSLSADIKEKIVFLQVPFDHLVALYRKASLFIFPSKAEGFGIPPLEALAYGCPLLCSNATAMNEFLFPDEVFFDPYDQNELEHKILQQLEKPSNLNKSRKDNFNKYDWKKISNDFYRLIIDKQL